MLEKEKTVRKCEQSVHIHVLYCRCRKKQGTKYKKLDEQDENRSIYYEREGVIL